MDSTGSVGSHSSLVLNSSGTPVISYFDNTNRDLKLVKCGNATCGASNSVRTVDSAGSVGMDNAMALNSNGYPIISYLDDGNFDLRLLVCGNATCSGGNTIHTLDSAGFVGLFTAIALDSSGKPVISYYDDSNGDLKVLFCGTATCSAGNTIRVVDSVGTVGQHTDLALNSSGKPVISYQDVTNRDLKVVFCGDTTCSAGNTIRTVDRTGDVGQYTSLKLDSSGNAVISYYDYTNRRLKLARVAVSAGGVAASAVAVTETGTSEEPLDTAQPLTTTEVAAAPAVADTATQTQRLFLPLVDNNGTMAASDGAPSVSEAAPQSAAVEVTTAPTLTLTAADPNAGAPAPAAVITTSALVSVPVAVEATPVVTTSAPVSVPVVVENAPIITESVPVSVPGVEVAPVLTASVPVSVPVVEPAPVVAEAPAVTTTQNITPSDAGVAPVDANAPPYDATTAPDATAPDVTDQNQRLFLPIITNLAGAALSSPGGMAAFMLVVLVIGGIVWRRRSRNR